MAQFLYELQSKNTSPRFGRHKIAAPSAASVAEDKRRSIGAKELSDLHDAVIAAKKTGNSEAIAKAKADLQAFRDAKIA